MVRFNGPEYQTKEDHKRLSAQHTRIKNLMLDAEWRTLREIARLTGDPVASISAQLRHLRKERFGGYIVDRRSRGNRDSGLFEYRVLLPRTDVVFEKRACASERLKDAMQALRQIKDTSKDPDCAAMAGECLKRIL